MSSEPVSSEPASLKDEIARFAKMVEPIVAVAKVKPTAPEAAETLAKALQRFPPGETFGRALDEMRERFERLVEETRSERARSFRPVEAEFVGAAQADQQSVREQSQGWRIGPLGFDLRREQAQARVTYNREQLLGWTTISGPEDLDKLRSRAAGMLEAAVLPEPLLVAVFWDAYAQERSRRELGRTPRPARVPILDFYREVRATLVRHQLAGEKPEKRLRYVDLPRWQFLYNLDRYRALGAAGPEGRRLGLETGSQVEVGKGLGLVVNGLDAEQDYKTVCFVVASPPTTP